MVHDAGGCGNELSAEGDHGQDGFIDSGRRNILSVHEFLFDKCKQLNAPGPPLSACSIPIASHLLPNMFHYVETKGRLWFQ